jgi:hypothetical protein
MMSVATSVDVLTTIARSLVVAQEYPSIEEALQGMAVSEVQRKIAYYRRRIRGLERKYGTDFDTFSARIQGRATPSEEDDWLAWRSANTMLADWQKTSEKLRARARN